jgi:dihydropyrimidinase
VDDTAYEGIEITGWPVVTIARGEIIARDGVFTGTKGRGRFLKREKRQDI